VDDDNLTDGRRAGDGRGGSERGGEPWRRVVRTMSTFGRMGRTALLVHGAWHGAWAWDRVVARLSSAGLEAIAIDLPGHGDDPAAFGDLHGDAGCVRRQLDRLGSDVVLVGHSYGGAVITEAGDHPAVDHLVYVAAFALDADESCAGAATEWAANQPSHAGRPDLSSGIVVTPDDSITLDPLVAAQCLYNHCDEQTVAWALERLGPQPLVTMLQEPAAVAWRNRPSTYLVCTDDMAVDPDLQRIMARRCGSVVEWDTDHSPFLSHPDLVAGLLVDLANS
jgi:pimeloyl-ACP methyl ester carboxylesterase